MCVCVCVCVCVFVCVCVKMIYLRSHAQPPEPRACRLGLAVKTNLVEETELRGPNHTEW